MKISNLLLTGYSTSVNKIKNTKFTVLFLLIPSLLFLLLFIAYPVFETFRLSFFKNWLLRPEDNAFIGFSNYSRIFGSVEFSQVFIRTLFWTVGSVTLKLILGFCGGILLSGNFRGKSFFRTTLLLSWILPLSIGAFVWNWVYNGQYGLLNGVLLKANLIEKPFELMAHEAGAFWGCLVNDVWVGVPLMTLIVLAGLQSVPQELYEAASVDGASKWSRFRFITIPQLKSVVLIGLLLSIVWTFNSFDIIWVHTRGGPLGATTTLVVKTFKAAFEEYRFGLASAFSTITFLVLLIFSLFYSRFILRDL
jgi:multiple sugar transport system permease protein